MTTRRQFVFAAATAATVRWPGRSGRFAPPPAPRPTPAQLRWQRDELALFVHFGMNTFTDREWGDGRESPSQFAPSALDARQWARTARAAGARGLILTAKHHDGFCLWPTATTSHSVASSPWRGGHGDLVREFVDACRAEGLGAGLYLSPWDRNAPSYGDSPRYNDMYVAQLTELLTRYGRLSEVWFDGANGEGPNGRKQAYDWPRVWNTVARLQPDAVIFSDAGPGVRWIGNENGAAGETNWSTVDPSVVSFPGASGDGVIPMLQHGDPHGSVWRPGESDVSIRPGWFYHAAEDARVRSADNLVALYFSSVGRNSKLLLNVPPGPDGLIHNADVAALTSMRSQLDSLLQQDVARRGHRRWTAAPNGGTLEVSLREPTRIAVIDLGEQIEHGQAVARFRVDARSNAAWAPIAEGTTIGCRRLLRVPSVMAAAVRVVVTDSVRPVRPVALRLHRS